MGFMLLMGLEQLLSISDYWKRDPFFIINQLQARYLEIASLTFITPYILLTTVVFSYMVVQIMIGSGKSDQFSFISTISSFLYLHQVETKALMKQ